ncbi:SpoIIE family protein phosphatase [Marinactinospora rubrisoli]|uniref:SpoIIE family protein phosphatase n=1 Tax=Marinactinospora rubrisoli TaxID=2715399 RepID=A0ABW2KLY4_9ACTN
MRSPVEPAFAEERIQRGLDGAVERAVRETGASVGGLYLRPPGERVLWLTVLTGMPPEIAAPWMRVAPNDPMPVADAVRDGRLVWINGPEEMARRYPRPAVVLPYQFCLAAAPIVSGAAVHGGLVLMLPASHPPWLSRRERVRIRTACRAVGRLLGEAAAHGRPVRPGARPRLLVPPRAVPPAGEPAAAVEFVDRLPGGACALDLSGRITFVTPAAAGLLGVRAAGLVGRPPWEALPWMDVPEVEDAYRSALISREPVRFTALRPPDRWLSFELYPDASGISVRVSPAAEADSESPARRGRGAAATVPSRSAVLYHLMHLAVTLTETVSVQDVVDQAADQLMSAVNAEALALMTAEDGRLHIIGFRGYGPDLMARFDAVPLTTATPAVHVLNTGVPSFFSGFAELRRSYPEAVRLDDMASWAFLPLIASGRPVGTLVLAYARRRHFAPGERAVLTSLAGVVAQALDRARLFEAKRDLAHRLQAGLLPHSLPDVPGLRVSARYLPARRGMGVGGDFYDLIRIDATTVAAAIGDVQGHNVDAAALMGQVRTAVHAHATAGASPSQVLARTNRLLTDLDPGLFTSCVYLHLDLRRHRVRVASAGHPPPLLRRPDGRVEEVRVPRGLLLGIEPDVEYPAGVIGLPPGAVLALYTDGLVEAPGVDIERSTAVLAGHLARSDPHDLDAVADTLVACAATRGDDIALLLVSPGEAAG